MKKIALYGGAFSPPHLGHASVIEAILRLFPCDEIWVMPSADRHDKIVSASGEHRMKMLEILIQEIFPDSKTPIIVSDFELALNKPTATHVTLKLLKEKYPENEFYFILGSENLNDIQTKWIEGEKLFQEAKFIAIRNPRIPLVEKLPPHLTILDDIAWSDISSTFIRKILSQGYSGLPYLSKRVVEYIKRESLYR